MTVTDCVGEFFGKKLVIGFVGCFFEVTVTPKAPVNVENMIVREHISLPLKAVSTVAYAKF